MMRRIIRRMIGRLALPLLLLLTVLAGVVCWRSWRMPSRQLSLPSVAVQPVDAEAAAARLAGALRFQTVAADADGAAFTGLHAYLAQTYPHAHAALRRELVGGYSLLYRWQGSDASALPALLLAHQDVVPAPQDTLDLWTHEPFGGVVRDGYVWGRGAWDDKSNLVAILEAVDRLAAAGFRPRRTIYLAFGHDEESGGQRGARAMAALLRERGVRFDFVLDEGLLITDGMLQGVRRPVALVGVAEKGYMTVQLELAGAPGHASMPGPDSAIGAMGAALARLDRQRMPAALDGVARDMFETLAPEMEGFNRVALANLWLFGPLLQDRLARAPATDALQRTTTALTMVKGGERDNVLPGVVRATANFRLLPGDSEAGVLKHVRQAVGNDAIRLAVAPGASAPSPIAATGSTAYRNLQRAIGVVFPQALVAPGLMVGATDARHYAGISANVYRFSPVLAQPQDLQRFHGVNERIAVSNFADMIRFYQQLLHNDAQQR